MFRKSINCFSRFFQLAFVTILTMFTCNLAKATCSKFPKDISLSDASFSDTKHNIFSVSAAQVNKKTDYQAIFNMDGDGFYYSDAEETWCIYDKYNAKAPVNCLDKYSFGGQRLFS